MPSEPMRPRASPNAASLPPPTSTMLSTSRGCAPSAPGPQREYVYAPTFVVILRIGSVNGGKRWAIDGLVFHVRDYSDDRSHRRIRFRFASVGRKKFERREHADRFPNWIFVGEELPREGLIDNRNPGRGLGVVFREKTA